MRTARYVNIGVWFWLLASDVLNPVSGKSFWDRAFSLNSHASDAPRMTGNAIAILILWFAVDLLLRWLWSQGGGHQQRED